MDLWRNTCRQSNHSRVILKQYLHLLALAFPENAKLHSVRSIWPQTMLWLAAADRRNHLSMASQLSPSYSRCASMIKDWYPGICSGYFCVTTAIYILKYCIHSKMVETCRFIDLRVFKSSGAWPDLGHPSQSGSSSDMSTNSPECILATIFLVLRGNPAPLNSAGLFPLANCSCWCSGGGLMDLPITATWCNYSGSGMHPSSIREAKRVRGIYFI